MADRVSRWLTDRQTDRLTGWLADWVTLQVALGLYRPAGTLGAQVPYVYTVPRTETIVVRGDRVYLLKQDASMLNNKYVDAFSDTTVGDSPEEPTPKSLGKDLQQKADSLFSPMQRDCQQSQH